MAVFPSCYLSLLLFSHTVSLALLSVCNTALNYLFLLPYFFKDGYIWSPVSVAFILFMGILLYSVPPVVKMLILPDAVQAV